MIDQINELPEDGLKSSPETSRYTENKWISRKNQNKLYFLHLIDILSDLLLICRITIHTSFIIIIFVIASVARFFAVLLPAKCRYIKC